MVYMEEVAEPSAAELAEETQDEPDLADPEAAPGEESFLEDEPEMSEEAVAEYADVLEEEGGQAEDAGDSDPADQDATTGSCGEGLTWSLDGSGSLSVTGVGAMEEYEYASDQPWRRIQDNIKAVVVVDGVTRVSSNVFLRCENIASLSFPASMKSIGESAFLGCTSIVEIEIPRGVEVGKDVFRGAKASGGICIGEGASLVEQSSRGIEVGGDLVLGSGSIAGSDTFWTSKIGGNVRIEANSVMADHAFRSVEIGGDLFFGDGASIENTRSGSLRSKMPCPSTGRRAWERTRSVTPKSAEPLRSMMV